MQKLVCFLLFPFAAVLLTAQQAAPDLAVRGKQLLLEGKRLTDEDAPSKAIPLLLEALRIFRAIPEPAGEVVALNNLGAAHDAVGQRPKALEYYQLALPLRQRLMDRRGEAITRSNMGLIYSEMRQPKEALAQFELARGLIDPERDPDVMATTLNNIGRANEDMGEKDKALQYYSQSRQLYRGLRSPAGEARTLNNMGSVWDDLGEKQKALEHFNAAIPLWRAARNRSGEANTLNSIGLVFATLGNRTKALEYYDQALRILQQAEDPEAEANVRHNVAAVLSALGDKKRALEQYTLVLSRRRQLNDRYGEADTLNSIAGVYYDLSDKAMALRKLEEALTIWREISDRAGMGRTLHNMGGIYSELGNAFKGLDYCLQALPLRRFVRDSEGEAYTFGQLADIESSRNPSMAIWYAKQALNTLQRLRQNISGLRLEQRKSLDEKMGPRFLSTAVLLVRQERLAEAQQVLDLLKEAESYQYGRADSTAYLSRRLVLTAREQRMTAEFESHAKRLETLASERTVTGNAPDRSGNQGTRVAELDRQLLAANGALRRSLEQSAAAFFRGPERADDSLQVPEANGLRDLLRRLGQGTGVIYALAAKDDYAALLVTAGAHKVYWSKIGRTALNKKIREFRGVLRNPGQDPLAKAQELHKLLLPDGLKAQLGAQGVRHIMWSLDDQLRYLPVGALHDGKEYLAFQFRHSLFSPASEKRLTAEVPRNWVGVAFGATRGGSGFSPLPAVREECEKIFGFGVTNTIQGQCKLDQNFTKAALLDRNCRCNVVHIASHFLSRPGTPADSKLLLGDGGLVSVADLEEQTTLFDGVDLLTLSACETGLSSLTDDGREIDSLASVMERLGAKAVLASLWSVNDRSTALFMQEFYKVRQSAPGMTKAEALQRAQRAMLEGQIKGNGCGPPRKGASADVDMGSPGFACEAARPYAHPYYWAPFVLMGNWK